jgi:hypothetical protein
MHGNGRTLNAMELRRYLALARFLVVQAHQAVLLGQAADCEALTRKMKELCPHSKQLSQQKLGP